MIGALLLLLIVFAAYAVMVGATKLALRLVILAALLAVVVPFVMTSGLSLASGVAVLRDLVIVAVGVLLVVGFVRYLKHKKKVEKYLSPQPTSLKKRVERD